MKAGTQESTRRQAQRRRRPPTPAWTRRVPWQGKGELETPAESGPVELILEATNGDGELSTWFDDFWWVDVLTLYRKRAVTIHLAPTRDALLNPAVLHQFEMLRRVEPQWKAIGYVFAQDLPKDATALVATTPYHEIRIIDRTRGRGASMSCPALDELIESVRDGEPGAAGRKPMLIQVSADDPPVARIIGTPAGA